eukprot:g18942.t1
MGRTNVSTRPWVILIAQVLAQCYFVLGVLETKQDALDANNEAAATAGGGTFPEKPTEPGAADDDVILAARTCVALDGSRPFPADQTLGLFEMSRARANTPRITAASVEFAPQQMLSRQGVFGVDPKRGAGAVGVSLRLEVDITDERTQDRGGEAEALGLHVASGAGESVPTRREVVTAAVEAAAVTNGATEAQLAISALAAWNLVLDNGIAQEGSVAGLEIRIEVAAAFGYRGHRYTASKRLALAQEDGHMGGDVVPLSVSFAWHPTGDVWASLDGPAVADVKVYGAPSAAMTGWTSKNQGEPLLLQATLCKRASPSVVTGTAKRPATASIEATLEPYIEQNVCAKLEADAATSNSSSRPPVVVSEIQDAEWWKAREEEENGRGMDAVNALPRIPGWKPGDWRKRRRRRRRQEEERERAKIDKASRRRAGRRGGEGDSGTGGRDGSKKHKRQSGWGFVKGVWRAVGRMLQGATGKLRRKE